MIHSVTHAQDPSPEHPLGDSRSIHDLVRRLGQAARRSDPLLISGESGTGKRLAAKLVHHWSPRRTRPFVARNASSLEESRIAENLFGRASNHSAIELRQGAFQSAAEGTLLLAHVDTLSLAAQADVLDVLESGRFTPLGQDRSLAARARVIATTSRNLSSLVESGEFLRDLRLLLHSNEIRFPPLRERVRDIPLLVEHLIGCYRDALPTPVSGVDNDAMCCLLACPWYGNVRELACVIERGLILGEDCRLRVDDLPAYVRDCSIPSHAAGPCTTQPLYH